MCSFRTKTVVILWSYLAVCINARGQPDARGKTSYNYVSPLIRTTNGGQQKDPMNSEQTTLAPPGYVFSGATLPFGKLHDVPAMSNLLI